MEVKSKDLGFRTDSTLDPVCAVGSVCSPFWSLLSPICEMDTGLAVAEFILPLATYGLDLANLRGWFFYRAEPEAL